jgi:8-oxo-dGTP diphosphatase
MIDVVCAVISREDGKILAAQRSERMPLPLKWEFPGGKIDPGERAEDALRREINEELSADIRILARLEPVVHHYPGLSICLQPFHCEITGGDIVLKEHTLFCWLPVAELSALDWAEADVPVVARLMEKLL